MYKENIKKMYITFYKEFIKKDKKNKKGSLKDFKEFLEEKKSFKCDKYTLEHFRISFYNTYALYAKKSLKKQLKIEFNQFCKEVDLNFSIFEDFYSGLCAKVLKIESGYYVL